MYNKNIKSNRNERVSVEYILRGAKRRRDKALEVIRSINSDAGIQANLFAVK